MDSRTPLPRSGVIVPMITPLTSDRTLDADSLASFAEWLIAKEVDGLLVLGSSGENAALSRPDRVRAVEIVSKAAAGRAHVMAGVAALGTADARSDAAEFAAAGADSLLVPAPFGFELSQTELAGHFRSVASDAAGVPLVAYEVPSRVKVSLGNGLVSQLVGEGVIAGLKDSSGNLAAARLRAAALRDAPCVHYTGSEECIDAFLLGGGHGSVPGLANVFPQFHVRLARLARAGDWEGAREVQNLINRLIDLYFQPLPDSSFTAQFFAIVKEALRQQGVIADAATSAPFVQGDAGIAEHVSRFLERVDAEIEPELKALS